MGWDFSLKRNLVMFQLDKKTTIIWVLAIGYWRESKQARKPLPSTSRTRVLYINVLCSYRPAILSLRLYRNAHSKRMSESSYSPCWYGRLRKEELSHRRVPHRAEPSCYNHYVTRDSFGEKGCTSQDNDRFTENRDSCDKTIFLQHLRLSKKTEQILFT